MSFRRVKQLRSPILAMAIGLLVLCGCSRRGYDGPERAAVIGQVTLDGVPVQNGVMNLIPAGGDGLRKASTLVEAGSYDLPEAKGPNVGTYRVEILWRKPTGRKIPGSDMHGSMVDETAEAIPSKYNTQTTLQIEITPGRNRHDFQLTSK